MFGPLSLLLPPLVLLTSLATLPFTVLILTVTGRSSSLLSWPKLRHAWFKHFWWWFGPGSKAVFAPSVKPLLLQARGFVLDIGPASGVWMPELAAAARNRKISKIYGVEPNEEFQGPLREAAKRAGLADVYEPVAAFAQDLEARGIEKGSVDTIVTVHVLCSVGPHAEELVKVLYDFLKPGGQWLVYEHVAAQNSPARMCQGREAIRGRSDVHTSRIRCWLTSYRQLCVMFRGARC